MGKDSRDKENVLPHDNRYGTDSFDERHTVPAGNMRSFMEVGVDVDQLAQCAIRTCFTAFLPMVKTVVLVVSILFLTVIDPKRLRTSN